MLEYQYDDYFAPDHNPFRSISLWRYESFRDKSVDEVETLMVAIRQIAAEFQQLLVIAIPKYNLKNDRLDYTSVPKTYRLVSMADAVITYEKSNSEPSGYDIKIIKSRHDKHFNEHLKFAFLKEAYRYNFD